MKYTYIIIQSMDCSITNTEHLRITVPYYKLNIRILFKTSTHSTMKNCTQTFWKKWLKKTSIRAIKAAAQTAIATIGTSAIIMNDVNWAVTASASVLSAIISILNSIVEIPED